MKSDENNQFKCAGTEKEPRNQKRTKKNHEGERNSKEKVLK